MKTLPLLIAFSTLGTACTAPAGPKTPAPASATVTSPLTARTTCIADLLLDASRRDDQGAQRVGPSMPHEDYRVHEVPWDLDGDGKPEHQVLRGCGATGNCDRLLYLTGAGCAHYAGILAGSLMIRLPAKSHGLPDLATYWVNGCGGQEGVATHLSFDGATYRAITTTQCPCGDQPDAGPRPASCPPWE